MPSLHRWSRTLLLILALAATAHGQGFIQVDRWWSDQPEPIVVPPGTQPLVAKSAKIGVDIRDLVATTTVSEGFRNSTGRRIEGTFLFPLPEGAGVTDFGMTIDGQEVKAELMPADKARQIYETIVRRERDPALLEYVGRDLFRARIFPIQPGEVKQIKLEYTQPVTADDGLARFVFPLRSRGYNLSPPPPSRPIPMMRDEVGPPPRPGLHGAGPGSLESLSIAVTIDSRVGVKAVYSPTHDIDLHRDGEHLVKLSYEDTQVVPDQDFVLYYQLSDKMYGLSLIPYRNTGDDQGTFMLLLAPRSEIREQDIAAKDIVFVLDTSGSMSGDKINQAKAALTFCVNSLKATDRFNILAFSSEVTLWQPELQPGSAESKQAAGEFIKGLQARGGTNIDEVLQRALAMLPQDRTRPAMVLFLTDGQPTVGETRIDRILTDVGSANKADARLFVFGVGTDVNTRLLDTLSADNKGTRTYVAPDENIETAVSGLYSKIGSPVLSNLKLTFDGVKVDTLMPAELPDLFRGTQLSLLGRYTGSGKATVKLAGTLAGEPQTFSYDVDFPDRDRANPFVPRLWATRRVGWLLEQIRLNGQNKELVNEVTGLATRYGILTPYTSYLVLEPGSTPGTEVAAELGRRFRHGDAADVLAPTAGVKGAPGVAGNPAPVAAPTGPPAAMETGAGAVARSQAEGGMAGAGRSGETAAAVRAVAGRTFYQLDGVWIDSTYPADPGTKPVIKVKYGSDAYFELLGLREDMRELLALGPKMKLAFAKALLVIGDDGDETLTDAARQALKG